MAQITLTGLYKVSEMSDGSTAKLHTMLTVLKANVTGTVSFTMSADNGYWGIIKC